MNGAQINHVDKYGQSCIFYAIRNDHLNTVELLVNRGADFNIIDNKQDTPLSVALKNNCGSIEEYLKSLGAVTKRKISNKSKSRSKLDISCTSVADPKPLKYIFVTLDSHGNEIPMTNEDLIKFLEANPRIKNLLQDQLPTYDNK